MQRGLKSLGANLRILFINLTPTGVSSIISSFISPLTSCVLIPDNHSWCYAFLLSHLFSCCSCAYPNPTYLWRPNTMKKLSKLGGKADSQWERKRRGQGHPKDIGNLVNSKLRDSLPYQTTLPASWEICMQVKKQQNWTWNNRLVPNQERSMSRLCIVTLFI